MTRIWTHTNGRLKIGLVSITLFVMLLTLAGGLMQLNQPVDEALVQVKHIFRADPDAEESIAKEIKPLDEQPEKVEQSSLEGSETMANKDLVVETVPATPAEQQRDVRGEVASKPEVSHPSREEQGLSTEDVTTAETEGRVQTVELQSEEPATVIAPMSQDEAESKPGLASERVEEPSNLEKAKNPFLKLQQDTRREKTAQHQPSAVTVSPQQYQKVFNAWRNSAVAFDQETKLPGLLVENLRDVYPLFQMKPVAMVAGVAYDLEDGSRLADRSLDRYSTTVFEVTNPWDDWGSALRRIGVHPGDKVEVRYYLHGYVHNGIYGRCEQAIAWGIDKGLLARDVNATEVEVRGRAYAVRQQGGGQFGVFIPNQLRLGDGRTLLVDTETMAWSLDVALLKESGLL